MAPAAGPDLEPLWSFLTTTVARPADDALSGEALKRFTAPGSGMLLIARAADEVCGAMAAEALPWDSEELGLAVARVAFLAARGTGSEAERIAARLTASAGERGVALGWRALWMRITAGDVYVARGAARAGAEYMGTLVSYRRELPAGRGDEKAEEQARVRAATDADIPALRAIASRAFRTDRYHRDPLVDPGRVDAMWADSVENSVRGRASAVLVAGEAARADGFITLHRGVSFDGEPRAATGFIGLVAVAEEATGRGVGRTLVEGALGWFRRHRLAAVEVGTQSDNAAAIHLYRLAGFHAHTVRLDYRLALARTHRPASRAV